MDRRLLGAGLGLIRFGMEVFEDSIKKLGTVKLRNLLQRYTNSGRKATLTGTLATGILNSSTLLSLLTLGFVSAGMMSLLSAIGVLVGANIGSTFMGIVVGYLGFGNFSISLFALPLVATGGVMMIVTNNKRWGYRAKLFLGFGLFFLGIHFLKENVDAVSALFNFEQFQELSLRVFGVVGLVVTMLVQSSGAVTVMTLTALSAGLINFDAGFAIILGAALGTTSTALVASLSGTVSKKQLSVANLIFNAITVVLGIVFFHQFIWLTLDVLGFRDQQAIGIAIINAVFSTITSLAFVPFLPGFTRRIQRLIPERQAQYPLQILLNPLDREEQRYNEDIASVSLDALTQDKVYMLQLISVYSSEMRGIDINLIQQGSSKKDILKNLKVLDSEHHAKLYETITEQLDTIFGYINRLSQTDLDKDDRKELDELQQDFVRLSNACQASENIKEYIEIIRNSLDNDLIEIKKEIIKYIIELDHFIYTSSGKKKSKNNNGVIELVEELSHYRDNILSHIAPHIKKGDIGELAVSGLVNIVRELADQFKDIAGVINH